MLQKRRKKVNWKRTFQGLATRKFGIYFNKINFKNSLLFYQLSFQFTHIFWIAFILAFTAVFLTRKGIDWSTLKNFSIYISITTHLCVRYDGKKEKFIKKHLRRYLKKNYYLMCHSYIENAERASESDGKKISKYLKNVFC